MTTINIVGAGLAGSITAELLQREGFVTRVIDDGDSKAASPASSNLFITSWLKKFSSDEAANGIAVVERLYGPNLSAVPAARGVIDTPFSGGISAAMKVRHIAQRHILKTPDVIGTALQATSEGVDVAVGPLKETKTFAGPTVVCAGYRQAEVMTGVKLPDVWVKVGHCFLFEGTLAPGQSRLALVSPYVHEKLYQFDDNTIYYADSVAVKMDVYKKRGAELKQRTLDRARKHIGNLPIKEFKIGYRPFIDGYDFGYAAEVKPRVWVINGGGKNGMVAYANAASKVVECLKKQGLHQCGSNSPTGSGSTSAT